jgi:hypothetical protein
MMNDHLEGNDRSGERGRDRSNILVIGNEAIVENISCKAKAKTVLKNNQAERNNEKPTDLNQIDRRTFG